MRLERLQVAAAGSQNIGSGRSLAHHPPPLEEFPRVRRALPLEEFHPREEIIRRDLHNTYAESQNIGF